MEKPVSVNSKEKIATPNIFSLLKPYSGIVIVLIIMALLGSGVNMLIPKIIARAIDAFSSKHFDAGSVVIQFLSAAGAIFVFTFLQNIYSDLYLRKGSERSAYPTLR